MTFFSPGANSPSGQRSGDTMVVQAFPSIFPAKTPKTSLKKSPSPPSPPPGPSCHKAHIHRRHQYKKSLALASSTTQARPSRRFAPVMALHRSTCQRCVLMAARSRPVRISAESMHPATSVLFAKTRRLAPDSRCPPRLVR